MKWLRGNISIGKLPVRSFRSHGIRQLQPSPPMPHREMFIIIFEMEHVKCNTNHTDRIDFFPERDKINCEYEFNYIRHRKGYRECL